MEQHFTKELEGLNSFEALQDFSDKLNWIKSYFSGVDFTTTQTQIEKKQLSFLPPSCWQELGEHSPAWALLRKYYKTHPSVQDKETFIQTFQAMLLNFLLINADTPDEIKDLVHYFLINNITKCKVLLINMPVNVLNRYSFCVFIVASLGDDGVMFDLLLAKGLDLNVVNHRGDTALHIAAKKNKVGIVEILLKRNVDTTKTNAENKTALQVAANEGFVSVVLKFLRDTPEGQAITEKKSMLTHLAAVNGHVELFNLLLEQGMEATVKDATGKDCLAYALVNGKPEIILAACKAKINRHALTPADIQAVLQAAYQHEDKETIGFFFGFIAKELMKKDQNLYEKIRNDIVDYNLIVPIDAGMLAKITSLIDQKLQTFHFTYQEIAYTGKRSYMPGVPLDIKRNSLLRQFTPRQLAALRRVDKGLNELVNDEEVIQYLVEAYGLKEEYVEECKQAAESENEGKPSRGNFAVFYKAYLRTWIEPVLHGSDSAEELLHAMATGQEDKVNALLAMPNHADVQQVAHPLRWAARKGHLVYVTQLIHLQARAVPEMRSFRNNGVLTRIFDYSKSALVEAAKYNRVECMEIFLGLEHNPVEPIAALRAAAIRGSLAAVRFLLDSNAGVYHAAVLEVLALAAKQGHAAIVTEVLDRIARDNRYEIHARDQSRQQALKEAIKNNHPAVILALLRETTLPALNVIDELREACRRRAPQLITALLTARNLSQHNLHGVFSIAAAESNLECVTLLLNDNRIFQDGQLDITQALVSCCGKNQEEEAFNFLMTKHKAEPHKYKISKAVLESKIDFLMHHEHLLMHYDHHSGDYSNILMHAKQTQQHVISVLCQLTPFLVYLQDKLIWACKHNQLAVIQAILTAHPKALANDDDVVLIEAIRKNSEACLVELLNAVSEPNYPRLINYAVCNQAENSAVILFKRWQQGGFVNVTEKDVNEIFFNAVTWANNVFINEFLASQIFIKIPITNYLPLARTALSYALHRQADVENFADRLTPAREMLQRWQANQLLSLHSKDTTSSFAKAARDFCPDGDLDWDHESKRIYRDALLDICDEMLMKAQVEQPGVQASPQALAKEADKKAMLALLKNGVNQLREQTNPKRELAVATYLLIASICDKRFSDQQKLDIIQAYQSFVKPWWQTCATALVCIISGAIGLVLGAAAGIGIGMLAGSWTGPGMALTTLAGALAGGVQGATLGVAAGAVVTGLVTGTAGLLAAKGLFKTPEQQLAEAVKLQMESHKPRLT